VVEVGGCGMEHVETGWALFLSSHPLRHSTPINSSTMAPRGSRKRGGDSSGSSKFSRYELRLPSGARSSRASATPVPSRASVTSAPARPRPQVRIADTHNDDPYEATINETSDQHSVDPFHAETDDDADTLNEVVMAVDLRDRGTVGCAYYIARDEKLYFMEDAHLGGVETVEARQFYSLIRKSLAENSQSSFMLSLQSS
jgi:hypothetical protein